MKNKLLFIGSLPPPLGGVSMINYSFQYVLEDSYQLISFDTSNKFSRVDLYKNKTPKDVLYSIILILKFLFFAFKNRNTVANIFITSGKAFYRTMVLYFIGYIFRIRFITHLHSKTTGEYFLEKRRLLLFIKIINNFSKKIILLSSYHKYYFCEHGLDPKKIHIIENFVNYSHYECRINNKNNDLLFVGRLSARKGIFDLFKSLKILKTNDIDFQIHFIGDYDNESTQNKIEQFIDINQLADQVILHGSIYGREKFQLYKNCGIFIFPSHFENSPLVIKEAIASKMAIICSDIKANKLILDQFENKVYHKVKDSVDLADKILLLLNNSKLRLDFMQSSSLITQFDSNIAKNKLTMIINELL